MHSAPPRTLTPATRPVAAPGPAVASAPPAVAAAAEAASDAASAAAEAASGAASAASEALHNLDVSSLDLNKDGKVNAEDAALAAEKAAEKVAEVVVVTDEARALLPSRSTLLLLGAYALGVATGALLYRTKANMRRFRITDDIPSDYFAATTTKGEGRALRGRVAKVSDGDTFRVCERPGRPLLSSSWDPCSSDGIPAANVATVAQRSCLLGLACAQPLLLADHKPPWNAPLDASAGKLSETTLQIRLAAVDTPETAKFGKSGQPYGDDAKAQLTSWLEAAGTSLRIRP